MLALVFLVILVVVGALFGYIYVTKDNTISSLIKEKASLEAYSGTANDTMATDSAKIAADNSQISKLQGNATALQSEVSQDSSTIQSLENQVSQDQSSSTSLENQVSQDQSTITSLQNQISSLQSQLSSDQSTITSLNNQVSTLQSQVSSLQAASLDGMFTSTTSTCGLIIDCSYTIKGAYANYGTSASNSASVTFTFYSGSGLTGQTLCSTTVVLGQVSGRSVNLLPTTVCSSSSTTSAASFTWSFSY
jgi:polyhydroxyalkanoate synthesis regulator phasin